MAGILESGLHQKQDVAVVWVMLYLV
jgi:hypothetical protein